MEAASARYAARDRFAYPTEPAATPLQRYIQNACSPENFEPNLALCLEIADVINAKKGNAPREAAIAIVSYINHRNPNVSLLALSLLDICVKNCGYPFHLQISTKEFLNELVRRFPERPPVRTTRVQNRILELIEEWRRTICETSKYKEDLGFIRDMHRLLSYKGYVFPEIRREDAAVLNPSDNLKSAEEMEAEERAAQSAKLQELIRRGSPHDLQEANKLMKVMAGYDTRHKTDYRAKAAEEVAKIQQKAKLLEEMLQGYKVGDEIKEGDVFEELANALASAHPKIQKMCEEESEDHEAVAKLFEINDSIHRTIERYRLVKKGDLEGASKIPRGTLGVSGAGVKRGVNDELSLIDFDADAAEQSTQSADGGGGGGQVEATKAGKGSALEDDLLGLNMGDGNYGEGGGISLGGGGGGTSNGTSVRSTADIMAQFSQPPQPSQQTTSNSLLFSSPPSIQQPQFPQSQQQQPSNQTFDFFSSVPTIPSQPPSKPATPIPQSQPSTQQLPPKKTDPFASLSTSTPPRQASPSPAQFQQSIPPSKSPAIPLTSKPTAPRVERASTFDLLGMGNGTMHPTATAASQIPPPSSSSFASRPSTADANKQKDDDEWTFSSALPDQPEDLLVTDSVIRTLFAVSRLNDTEVEMRSRISNSAHQPISDLTFQLAVTKGYTLHLQPQSGRSLKPKQTDGITQTIRLEGVPRGQGMAVKLRWRASYKVGGEARNEQGEVVGLGVL